MPDLEWIAHYKDGSELKEERALGAEAHHFGHIDQKKLKTFELTDGEKSFSIDVETGIFDLNGLKVKSKALPEGAKYRLVYFRRVRRQIMGGAMSEYIRYCFGLQTTVDKRNYEQLVWIEPDSTVTISERKFDR